MTEYVVTEGSAGPGWAGPRAEGEKVIAGLPAGRGELAAPDGIGHYPHAQAPGRVLALAVPFPARTPARA